MMSVSTRREIAHDTAVAHDCLVAIEQRPRLSEPELHKATRQAGLPLPQNTLAAEKIAEAPPGFVGSDSEAEAGLEHVIGGGDVVAIVPIGLFHAAAVQRVGTAKSEVNGGTSFHQRVEHMPRHIN